MFDIALYIFTFLGTVFFLKPWNLNMAQGMFFVFGVLALFAISLLTKKQRELDDKSKKLLSYIILWSLISIFIHSFRLSLANTYAGSFINFCLLSEGFIYVFCACILYYLIVSYSRNFRIQYPLLAINLLNIFFALTQTFGIKFIWINNPTISGMMGTCSQLAMLSALSIPLLWDFRIKKIWIPVVLIPIVNLFLAHSYTGVMALFLAVAYYLKRKNQDVKLWIWISCGVLYIILNFNLMLNRLLVRFESWSIALWEIIKSPIIGWGFDNTLANNMIKTIRGGGFTYRHNDYLNIARDLGLLFLIMIILFVKNNLKNVNRDYLWISLWVILIGIFFQTNFYFPRIAIWGITILALKGIEKYETRSV